MRQVLALLFLSDCPDGNKLKALTSPWLASLEDKPFFQGCCNVLAFLLGISVFDIYYMCPVVDLSLFFPMKLLIKYDVLKNKGCFLQNPLWWLSNVFFFFSVKA